MAVFIVETFSLQIWRAAIAGRITGSTVTLVKTYKDTGMTVSFVSSDAFSELLAGTWETPQSRGSWRAERESGLVEVASGKLWRARRPTPRPDRSEDCWYGTRRLPDGRRVRCR